MVVVGKELPQDHEPPPGEAQPLGNMRASISSLRPKAGPPGLKHPTTHGRDGVESNEETEETVKQQSCENKLETPKSMKRCGTKKTNEKVNVNSGPYSRHRGTTPAAPPNSV